MKSLSTPPWQNLWSLSEKNVAQEVSHFKTVLEQLDLRLRAIQSKQVQRLVEGFHSHGGTPNSWLVYFMENPNLKWMMIWG